MHILSSPMLPEVHGSDTAWKAAYPPFVGGQDENLIEKLYESINKTQHPSSMSKWAILAFVRAVRQEFPGGQFDSVRDQTVVARAVGFTGSGSALRMARLVMDALAAVQSEVSA